MVAERDTLQEMIRMHVLEEFLRTGHTNAATNSGICIEIAEILKQGLDDEGVQNITVNNEAILVIPAMMAYIHLLLEDLALNETKGQAHMNKCRIAIKSFESVAIRIIEKCICGLLRGDDCESDDDVRKRWKESPDHSFCSDSRKVAAAVFVRIHAGWHQLASKEQESE